MASFAMKSAVCGTPLAQKPATKAAFTRMATVTRASAEEPSRRALLGAFVAGTALVVSRGAEAIDITDDRKVRGTGYDIIYEARDFDLPQSTRDGIDQYRGDLSVTKTRVAESINRLKKDLATNIEKAYWTRAREDLRNQLGTMRFDLDTIASSLEDKASRKAARKAADNFFVVVEELDGAMRKKDADLANKAYAKTLSALDTVYLG